MAAAMLVIGYGGNQFTPLLVAYRYLEGYSAVSVDVFLGAYVGGLVPGLFVAAALSDRHGRRPVLIAGVVASVIGSGWLAAGPDLGSGAIILGRLASGAAVGTAMAVGSTWVNELSSGGSGRPGLGARRASVALTAGLGTGAGVAGLLAQWAPWPLTLPYLVQAALAIGSAAALAGWSVETRSDPLVGAASPHWRLPRLAPRFRRVVLPMAPWIFGSAGVAYAIVPALVDARVGRWALLFTTALTVLTLAAGLLIQPVARRLDDASTARAVFVSMLLVVAGLLGAVFVAVTSSPGLAVAVALLLGCAYGIAVVSGLLEVQRLATAEDQAGLTGVYYALAYVGFLLPALLAELAHALSYAALLVGVTLVAVGCAARIFTGRYLHSGAEAGSAPTRTGRPARTGGSTESST